MKNWKIIEKEDVSPSRWFPVERHTVEVTDGSIVDDYYIAHLNPGAFVVPFDSDGNIILVREYAHALGRFVLKLPTGSVAVLDSPEEAIRKELKEELGCTNYANVHIE